MPCKPSLVASNRHNWLQFVFINKFFTASRADNDSLESKFNNSFVNFIEELRKTNRYTIYHVFLLILRNDVKKAMIIFERIYSNMKLFNN